MDETAMDQPTTDAQAGDPKLELLRRVPLFKSLDEEGLAEIGKIAEEIETKPGTVLTHEGRHEGYFFVIVSGSVRIERGDRLVNVIGPGDFLSICQTSIM